MIYYDDGEVRIRDLQAGDGEIFTAEEIAQGWHQTIDKYLRRLEDQAAGKCVALAAEYHGNLAGYVSVYPDARWGPFGGRGWPEIVDFAVLEKYRRKGIGTRIMDTAERIAAGYGDTVYLGVGLHSGYGSAQRMYVRRGYLPDGGGVWYGNQVCPPYSGCCNDDELVLYLSKSLKTGETER